MQREEQTEREEREVWGYSNKKKKRRRRKEEEEEQRNEATSLDEKKSVSVDTYGNQTQAMKLCIQR